MLNFIRISNFINVKIMQRIIFSRICLCVFFAGPALYLQGEVKQAKLDNFELQSSALINESGELISDPDYSQIYTGSR